jgi:uncharacterized protein YycO
MQLKLRYLRVSLGSAILLFIILVFSLHFRHIVLLKTEISQLKELMQDGDILCRLGDRMWSVYFMGLSNSDKRYSHMGIVKKEGDNISVINAEGEKWKKNDFVNDVSLEAFLKTARVIGLYQCTVASGPDIRKTAETYIGRPFDWSFDLGTDDKIYCTELIYAVLKKQNPAIRLKTSAVMGKEIIPLEAISDSVYFEELIVFK